MVRSIGIVLVILGLIAQPLVAAVPTPMVGESPHSHITSDSAVLIHAMDHQGGQDVEQPSETHCHESTTHESTTIAISAPSELCDNCDKDCCMNGNCASSCVVSGAAAIQKSLVNTDLLRSASVAIFSGACVSRPPSRIFHPPKYT